MQRIYPIYRHENKDLFLIKPTTPAEPVKIDGSTFLTGYLKEGRGINLISIGQAQSLLDSGIQDSTDSIDPVIELDSIVYMVDGIFMNMSTRGSPHSMAYCAANDNYRKMVIRWKNNDVGVNCQINLETGQLDTDIFSVAGADITEFGYKLRAHYINLNRIKV